MLTRNRASQKSHVLYPNNIKDVLVSEGICDRSSEKEKKELLRNPVTRDGFTLL